MLFKYHSADGERCYVAKYAHFQPQFRVIWPPLMNMTGELRNKGEREREGGLFALSQIENATIEKGHFAVAKVGNRASQQLHNAEPLHRRPAKLRLATRLWKI